MSAKFYEIRNCSNCGLRYPFTEDHPFGDRCPICLGATTVVHSRLTTPEPATTRIDSGIRLEALLDNIRSAWNVGAMFRTADGLGVDKLYLCGITPTPENEAVRKTSLGAEESVAWEYSRNALDTVTILKGGGYKLIALEHDERSLPLGNSNPSTHDGSSHADPQSGKMVLVVGNEITGIDPELLDQCDQIVHIPMHGRKRSLNVEVAFGIAAYQLTVKP